MISKDVTSSFCNLVIRDVSRRFFAAAADKIFIRRRRTGCFGEKFFAAAAVD
jgi:hypothetical protein